MQLVPDVGAAPGRPQPGEPQRRAVAVGEGLELVELGDVVPGDHYGDFRLGETGLGEVLQRRNRGAEQPGPRT